MLTRSAQAKRPAAFAGFVAAFLAAPVLAAPPGTGIPSAPLSGVLRADGAPLAGASLVVRGLTGAAASVVRVLTTDAEGTFCLADARPGVYAILAAVPGFRSATAQVLHGAKADGVSFVRLDLDRERKGVLPAGPGGAIDPWAARAVLGGDVLRDDDPVAIASVGGPAPGPVAAVSSPTTRSVSLPFRGSVASLQGFASDGGTSRSQTSVDVRGSLGSGVRWGVSGEYDRLLSSAGDSVGGASRVALDVLPADGHSIRVSTRSADVPNFDGPDARFDAHSVDWAASTDNGSRASVSARLLSHRNLEPAALHTPLFQGEGSALEVDARYRRELGGGRFLRVNVGYRSDVVDAAVAGVTRPAREARVGGVAGMRLLDAVLVEAGGTGDYSAVSRGLAPELTLSVDPLPGLTVYGFGSRRFEQRVQGAFSSAIVGVDAADLVRATRALYRAGARLEDHSVGRLELEGSRREISEAFQLLLDADAIDRVDALYLFPGDVADEVSGSFTFAAKADVAARLALQGGRVHGDGVAVGTLANEAHYWISTARVDVVPTGTTVRVQYCLLEQVLGVGADAYFSRRNSVDVTVSQEIPVPVLRAFGSKWQALFSVALGSRRDGSAEPRPNRQMAGGLSLTF